MDRWTFSGFFLLFLGSVCAQDWADLFESFDEHLARESGGNKINSKPRFVVLAPDVLRADSDENLVLQADGVSDPVLVSVQIWDFSKARVLVQNSASLEPSNGFHKTHTIRLPSSDLKPEEKLEKFVFLKVTFGDFGVFPPEGRLLPVSFHRGFIFIQTDKPVYNPGDRVLYRAFVSSLGFQAVEGTVSVDIKNPDGIVVWQTPPKRAVNGIYSDIFKLSELSSEGLWTVTAKFDHWEQNRFNSSFEVKKYVLPSFNVTLTPSKPFFSIDDDELELKITARFVYGAPVQGKAYVMFGVKHEREKIRLPAIKQITELDEGKVSLTKAELTAVYPNIRMLVGKSIYVKASVLTDSGGDLVEVEKGGITVVISPFVLSFRNAPRFFKPGLPLDLTVDARHHDGSPVPNVLVKLSFRDEPLPINEGTSTVTINMPKDSRTQVIQAETVQPGLRPEQQARKVLTLGPYRTPGAALNLLYVSGENRRVSVGDSITLKFNVILEKDEDKKHVTHVTYTVLSRGSILTSSRVDVSSQVETVVRLPVTREMRPSFRLVAFYSLPWSREEEVVVDSLSVDVEQACEEKVTIDEPIARHWDLQPGQTLKLRVKGEPGSTVSLVAVDKSVFLLRGERLTQSKMWSVLHQSAPCPPGGENARGVFSDSGLTVFSSSGFSTTYRKNRQCQHRARRRRSVDPVELRAELERRYQDELLRRCCVDGLRRVPMPYSCTRRSLYITEGFDCIRAFRDCCGRSRGEPVDHRMPTALPSFITTTTAPPASSRLLQIRPLSRGGWGRERSFEVSAYGGSNARQYARVAMVQPSVSVERVVAGASGPGSGPGSSEPEDEEPFLDLDEDEVDVRSQFQESWLWEDIALPPTGDGTRTLDRPLPGSITEWGIFAVGSSKKTGFCVADPYNVRAFKPFFVDLKLPRTVARNEQIEVKAVVYNHLPTDRKVIITLSRTSRICSVAFLDKHQQEVRVAAGASAVVLYSLVPLEVGDLPLEVTVVTKDLSALNDRVDKILRVVTEGVQKTEVWSAVLNPSATGGQQLERRPRVELKAVVPNSAPQTFINVRGHVLADSLQNSISPDALSSLLRLPGGCVEQNVASMSLPTVAFRYLEQSGQWAGAGPQRREEAIGYIRTGYSNQLAFRREDGSYPPYRKQGASTWITAFVVKVFSMAHSIIGVDEKQVCEPLMFLLKNRYKAELGAFKEENPVYSTTITGGLRGDDPQVTLTAFVLISLAEAKAAGIDCNGDGKGVDTEVVIRRVAAHLKKALSISRRPYTVAIAAYAVALVEETETFNPTDALMKAATDSSHWADAENRLFSLEATGYALLALVKSRSMTEAERAFNWLNKQRGIGGGYGSTQPTVIVLQALSEFLLRRPPQNLDLNVQLEMGARTVPYNFNPDTSYALRSERVPEDVELVVRAQGTGQGVVEVVTYYNQLHEEEEKTPCKHFDLRVTIEESTEPPPPEVVKFYLITIRVRALGPRDVKMVVLDVTLPTGFTPVTSDLHMLSQSVDKYVANFKIVDELSDRGSLILHLYKVSHKEQEILIFKLQQNFKVGQIQPSSVTAYEYYNPDHRCSRSFSPREHMEPLRTICQEHVCRCAEGDCCELKKDTDVFSARDREKFACKTVHHVFKVKVVSVNESDSDSDSDRHELEITQVINLGSEPAVVPGQTRTFLSHRACRDGLNLVPNQDYLLMGPTKDVWTLNSATNRPLYLLGRDTWVERWPTPDECSGAAFKQKCESLSAMATELSTTVCHL